jgi:hypothetical protein
VTETIQRPDSLPNPDGDDQSSNLSRRDLFAKSALVGVTAGASGLGLHSGSALAEHGHGRLNLAGGRSTAPIEVVSKMARWKKPQSLEFVSEATKRFSFLNWQSGNDDSVYYNLNIPSFFPTRIVAQPCEFSVLARDLQPGLLNLTFTDHLGNTTPTLKDYPVGPRQAQALANHGRSQGLQDFHRARVRNTMVR